MIGVVVVAHGDLAEALVNTARMVVAKPALVVAISFNNQDHLQCEASLKRAVEMVRHEQDGVLLLTDMFGGTPANIGLTLHVPHEVELLTGVNLPMLIKALQLCDQDLALADVAKQVKDTGNRAIAVASELLTQEKHA